MSTVTLRSAATSLGYAFSTRSRASTIILGSR
jgi:hypothetical protein